MTTTPDPNPKASAAAAKAYAKANRPWFKKKRYIALIVIGLFVIIGAASGGGGSSDDTKTEAADTSTDTGSNEPKSEDKAEKKPAEKKPAVKTVKVTATELIKAFEENEFAADQKYKGKTLEISGVVNKVETEMFDGDNYYLQLGGGGDFELLTVNCHDLSKSALASVSTGQDVVAIGKFDDGGSLGVEVKDCKLK